MMKHWLLLFCLIPSLALAKVEMFQIVVFNWDTETETLQLVSLGSGTAVGDDLILTNKHVVQTGTSKFADLLVLCQAASKAGESVKCSTAAGVAAAHPEEDVALVRPIDSAFFPKVRVSYKTKRMDDPVRVYGFPVPDQDKQGFGDGRTLAAFTAWAKDPSQPFKSAGDKLTVTRGKVQSRLQSKDTGFTYTLTDAKVDFGNSGGAAFDEYGDYLGIVTYKDQSGNSIFLEYHQIDDWVKKYATLDPNFEKAAYDFYKGTKSKPATKTVTSRSSSLRDRIRALREKRSTKTMTATQKRLYEYLRQKRAKKD